MDFDFLSADRKYLCVLLSEMLGYSEVEVNDKK